MDDSENKRRSWLICAGLVLAIAAAYAPVLNCNFVLYDDNEYVASNEMVKQGITWRGIIWAFTTVHSSNWHPLTWLSHMLDYQMYGMNATGHHLTSVLLHAANSVLLFLLLQRMTKSQWPSALVAALFALHPLHVESVAWIAERKDVLSSLFCILTIWFYADFAQRGSKCSLVISILLYALGLLAKPMLVTLPFLLFLLDWWPLRRPRRPAFQAIAEKTPFLVLSAVSCVVTFIAQQRGGAVASLATDPMGSRLENVPVAYVRYLLKTITPLDLGVFYPFQNWTWWQVWGAAVILIILTALILWRKRSAPELAVGWLWFLGMLVPVIGIVHVGTQSMADRYHYLPSIGLFILIVWAGWNRIPPLAAWCALAACGIMTWTQVHYWINSETLFRRAIAVTEHNSIMENNLGKYLLSHGKVDEALTHLQRAVEYGPGYPLPHLNLGDAYLAKGQTAQALSQFEIQVSMTPNDPRARFNFGDVLLRNGLAQDALPQLQRAAELDPGAAGYHERLGDAYRQIGKTLDAANQYEKTLQLEPDDVQARSSLAWLLATTTNSPAQNGARAVQLAQQAVKSSDSNDPKPLGILAAAYAQAGDFARARATAEKALELAGKASQPAVVKVLRKQLDFYQAGKPFRDSP